MLFSDTYLTVSKKSEGLFKDKGSKFISYVFPVKTETEIKSILSLIKKEHADARHYCYAWRLGPDKHAYRTNDDGEPSGTAGKPIFGQIQSNDLTNVLIVVVRYFGGTLLGVGGLINAYREAAADGINNNIIIEQQVLYEYDLNFEFEQMNDVMKLIKQSAAKITLQDFNDKCKISFYISKRNSEQFEEKMKRIPHSKLNFKTVL